eukprot:gene21512-27856_t
MFGHPVKLFQWLGIVGVFAGLLLEVFMSYYTKQNIKTEKTE